MENTQLTEYSMQPALEKTIDQVFAQSKLQATGRLCGEMSLLPLGKGMLA